MGGGRGKGTHSGRRDPLDAEEDDCEGVAAADDGRSARCWEPGVHQLQRQASGRSTIGKTGPQVERSSLDVEGGLPAVDVRLHRGQLMCMRAQWTARQFGNLLRTAAQPSRRPSVDCRNDEWMVPVGVTSPQLSFR